MLQRTNLTVEQQVMAAEELYNASVGSQEERQALEQLVGMLQRTDLTVEQRIRVAQAIY